MGLEIPDPRLLAIGSAECPLRVNPDGIMRVSGMSTLSSSVSIEFEEEFRDRIQGVLNSDLASVFEMVSSQEVAFAGVVLEDLQETGQLPSLVTVHYSDEKASMRLTAYAVPGTDGKSLAGRNLELVVSLGSEASGEEFEEFDADEISQCAIEALTTFQQATPSEGMHPEIRDMFTSLSEVRGSLANVEVRITVIVNGLISEVPDAPEVASGLRVKLDVWGIERLALLIDSGRSHESLEIDLVEYLGKPLPCITSTAGTDEFHCHLAVFPGELLHALYRDHGDRLLELNVRKFLQSTGKINKGIKKTLLEEPELFLAYNNGITATVEELEIEETSQGTHVIRKVRGLQIVNGGQTTASIHEAGECHGVDLSRVQVQAKITEIRSSGSDEFVRNISRYSNTQNRISEADLSSNHPFHRRLEELAVESTVPGGTTRWYYERSRGQFANTRRLSSSEPGGQVAFDARTPRSQKFDKIEVARTVNVWNELPHVACQGSQKSYLRFMKGIEKRGERWLPDQAYLQQAVARVIMFRDIDAVAKELEIRSYKVQVVCYTLSLISYRTAGRMDLDSVWNGGGISPALQRTVSSWIPRIHEEIVLSAGERNVTEWCKKSDCWARIQTMNLPLDPHFEEELAEGLELPTVGSWKKSKKSKPTELTPEERENQARVQKHDSDEWNRIITWGRESRVLEDWQLSIAGTILGYAAAGWLQVPSPRQTTHLVPILDLWQEKHVKDGDEDA